MYCANYNGALSKFDALVMPTMPMKSHRREDRAPYAMLTNSAPFDVTGHSGLSVPCGMSDRLPIGLILIGRHFDGATLMRLGDADYCDVAGRNFLVTPCFGARPLGEPAEKIHRRSVTINKLPGDMDCRDILDRKSLLKGLERLHGEPGHHPLGIGPVADLPLLHRRKRDAPAISLGTRQLL